LQSPAEFDHAMGIEPFFFRRIDDVSRRETMRNAAFTVGVFLAAACLAGSAHATTATSPNSADTASVRLRYHETQLETSHGARLLYSRIDRAAQEVCDDSGDFALRAAFAACERSAIADAVAQVDNTRLTAVYNDHFPSYPLAEATSLRLIPAILVIVG
jgi:UrcA family protein